MNAERTSPFEDERDFREHEPIPLETAKGQLFDTCRRKFITAQKFGGIEQPIEVFGPLRDRNEIISLKRTPVSSSKTTYEVSVRSGDGDRILHALVSGPEDVVDLHRGKGLIPASGACRGKNLSDSTEVVEDALELVNDLAVTQQTIATLEIK